MKRSDKTTRNLFLTEALKLFSEKGYDAVSVTQIASAVGCSAPALYKHYSGKQALFDAIVEKSCNEFSTRMGKLEVDFGKDSAERLKFLNLSEEEQIEVIKRLFLHTISDKSPTFFRKMMTVEQFRCPELATIYNKRYVDGQIDAFVLLMEDAINAGIYRAGDTKAMAVQYISPIIMYINVCDREPKKKQEALKAITEHIKQFNRVYAVQ